MRRSLRAASNGSLIAGLLLIGLGLRAEAAQAFVELDFKLTRSPEDVGSWYRPSDSGIKFYAPATVLTLQLASSGGMIQSGEARITNFSLPGRFGVPGLYFSFTSVPSLLLGNVTANANLAQIRFPDVSVNFMRGTSPTNGSPGTLVFSLTTGNTVIPGGCAGRVGDQVFSGIPLQLTGGRLAATSELALVASVCPYSTAAADYDDAFRVRLQGAVPEPGTALLVGCGLLLVLAVARRKSAR